jgi:uncharacterized protein
LARFRLIPREEKFYVDFMAMADQIAIAAKLLVEMVEPDKVDYSKAAEINDIEHTGDRVTRDIITRVNQTFITPIDREDIHALAIALDDVLDAIDHTASLFPLYRLDHARWGARDLAAIVARQAEEIRAATAALEKNKGLMDRVQAISLLEHDADRIHQTALRGLFDEETNAITLMKWKEVIDFFERTTDRADDVAKVMEGIAVKQG